MYEWDENKNNLNDAKHGLRFEVAVEVFSDSNAIVQFNRDVNGEIRDQIIGKIEDEIVILFVVFTKRAQKIRLISARKASNDERAMYENQTRTD
ncbi:MAG: BrnT family toxin [Burkholderiales bacterium]|nr:BrnT family toxin [Burkholderiales bacterium]